MNMPEMKFRDASDLAAFVRLVMMYIKVRASLGENYTMEQAIAKLWSLINKDE